MALTLINADLYLHEQRLVEHGWTVGVSGCWEWAGKTFHRFGYGQLRVNGVGYDAHRLAYRVWNGDIPEGFQVRHTCDNPSCINPAHLVLGTSQDNHNDMVERGRSLNGERNPSARLSFQDVEDIKLLYSLGASQGNIAKSFAVSQSTISLIVNGKRRKVW